MADKLVRPLNAPPGIQAAPGVQPGVNSPVVLARRVIIFGPNDGLFVYAGNPALGDLIVSIAYPAGTDQYGNAYPAGFFAGIINIGGADFNGGGSIASASGRIMIAAGSSSNFTEITVGAFQSGGGSITNPTFITTDTWHTAVLGNGWTGTAQYQLQPDNTVAIRSLSSLGAGTLTNGTVLFTLPAAYWPSLAQVIPCLISAVGGGSVATGDSPYLQVGTDGTVEVFNVAVPVATNVRIPMSLFSLT
jgi:hypothetical protein